MTGYFKKRWLFAVIFLAVFQLTPAAAENLLFPGTFFVDPVLTKASINARMTEKLLNPAEDNGSQPNAEEVFAQITSKEPNSVYQVFGDLVMVLNEDGSSVTKRADGSESTDGKWAQNGRNFIVLQKNGHLVGTVISNHTVTVIIGGINVYLSRQ